MRVAILDLYFAALYDSEGPSTHVAANFLPPVGAGMRLTTPLSSSPRTPWRTQRNRSHKVELHGRVHSESARRFPRRDICERESSISPKRRIEPPTRSILELVETVMLCVACLPRALSRVGPGTWRFGGRVAVGPSSGRADASRWRASIACRTDRGAKRNVATPYWRQALPTSSVAVGTDVDGASSLRVPATDSAGGRTPSAELEGVFPAEPRTLLC